VQFGEILPVAFWVQGQQPLSLHQRVRANQKVGKNAAWTLACSLSSPNCILGIAHACNRPYLLLNLKIHCDTDALKKASRGIDCHVWMCLQLCEDKWSNDQCSLQSCFSQLLGNPFGGRLP